MDLTVKDAAERLGITRRHTNELLTSGELEGRQLSSGAWLIDSDSIARFERRRKGAGRRLSPETAWAILIELSGVRADWLPARTYARVRERIRNANAETLAAAVANRTRAHHFHADGARVDGIIPTGRAASFLLNTDLIEDPSRVTGYVPSGADVMKFANEHYLIPDPAGPDVLIENNAPIPLVEPLAGVVAADLAASIDPRECQAGIDALENLRKKWLAANSK